MKTIFSHIGSVILEVIIIGLLFAFLFTHVQDGKGNKGIINILGSYDTVEAKDFTTYKDASSADAYTDKERPVIKLNTEHSVMANQEYSYDDFFVLEGEDCKIRVKNLSTFFDNANKTVKFTDSGKYTVEVRVFDKSNHSTASEIVILVNR